MCGLRLEPTDDIKETLIQNLSSYSEAFASELLENRVLIVVVCIVMKFPHL